MNFSRYYSRAFDPNIINIVNIPRPTLGFCEAINEKDYVIDPNGFLYKCWAHIGHKDGQVGNIFDGINFNEIHNTFTKFKLLKDEKCTTCKIQPLCLSGCPLISMNNKESKCISLKYNIEEQLKIYVSTIAGVLTYL